MRKSFKPNYSELLLSQSVIHYRYIQFCCSFQSKAIFNHRVVTIDRSVAAEEVRLAGIDFKMASLDHAFESAEGYYTLK